MGVPEGITYPTVQDEKTLPLAEEASFQWQELTRACQPALLCAQSIVKGTGKNQARFPDISPTNMQTHRQMNCIQQEPPTTG